MCFNVNSCYTEIFVKTKEHWKFNEIKSINEIKHWKLNKQI